MQGAVGVSGDNGRMESGAGLEIRKRNQGYISGWGRGSLSQRGTNLSISSVSIVDVTGL